MHNLRFKISNIFFVIITLLIFLLFSLFGCTENKPLNDTKQIGLVEYINKYGKIRAAYGDYPPFSLEDPITKKVNGFSVDLLNHIAKELKVKIEWSKINWDTMSADLKRGSFDLIASPIFQTIPRAPEFCFSDPYIFFADGIAVVRINDDRFNKFSDLDRSDLKLAVGLGQASEALVRASFSKPTIHSIRVGTDNMLIFNGVLTGRADVAVADKPNALRFVNEHKDKVKALWVKNPPAFMPAGFALRPGDIRGAEFLNVCIRYLKSIGILDQLKEKYNLDKKG